MTNTLKGGAKASRVPENDDYVDPKKILSLMQVHSRQKFTKSYPDGFRVTESEYDNRLRVLAYAGNFHS